MSSHTAGRAGGLFSRVLGDGLVFTYRDVTAEFEAAERLRDSERLYRLLSENTSDVVFALRDGLVTYASPSVGGELGWTPQEMLGRPWSDFLEPAAVEALTAVAPRIAAGERIRHRTRFRARDGSARWARLATGPLLDEADRRQGTLISARWIDEEVAAEEALRESHRQLDRLVEQLPVGVFRARPDTDSTVVEFVSARVAELLGLPPGDLVTVHDVLGALDPGDADRLRAVGLAAVTEGRPLFWEGRRANADPTVWLRIRANVDTTSQGIILDGLVSDITAAKSREAALAHEADLTARRAERLAEIDRTKSALLATLGHDLRTPLAAIASAATTLQHRQNLPTDQVDELLANIQGSSDALVHMVTDLLDLSRIEAGALPIRLGGVDLVEVLAEPLRRAGDGVQLDLPDDLPCIVADAGLLERVIDNLLRNARQHAPGSPVTLRARRVGDRARIGVIDHGPGVAPDRYDQIFVPFHRISDRHHDGIGLGLSIARVFVLALDGTITPSATPGGGLTMTIELKVCHDTDSDR